MSGLVPSRWRVSRVHDGVVEPFADFWDMFAAERCAREEEFLGLLPGVFVVGEVPLCVHDEPRPVPVGGGTGCPVWGTGL